MKKEDREYQKHLQTLRDELVVAMGCTEPAAIALATAKARDILGGPPERIVIEPSESIIKNVQSVIVPNTGGLRGLKAAAAAGIVRGDASRGLEVLANLDDSQKPRILTCLAETEIIVKPFMTGRVFDLRLTAEKGQDEAVVRITDNHTNIVRLERNGDILFTKDHRTAPDCDEEADRVTEVKMTVASILAFADSVDLDEIKDLLDRQIRHNTRLAEEGFVGDYGANIGSVLLVSRGDDVKNRAAARAAAASDARMSGAELPAVIVSGSGNQGITASLPIIEYAKELDVSEEKLHRALVLANLLCIHQKANVGCLSAYCGAVFAGTAAAAGIAYLHGESYDAVVHTIANALAVISGMVCDGAKPSCAAKIAMAVDAGMLGYDMYRGGVEFKDGEGIIAKGIENTLDNVARLAREGMRETNRAIVDIMTEKDRRKRT